MQLENIDDIKYYKFDSLNVRNYFFIKPLNFLPTLESNQLQNNYNKIKKIIDSELCYVSQKHTNKIKKVTLQNAHELIEADGMITNEKGLALAIKVADCQAIFLYDEKNKVIGNVHSGWRGTVNKIIKNAIDIMVNDYSCNINDIQIYICPSIGGCHFEVDNDVYELFKINFKEFDIDKYTIYKHDINKYYIDTFNINKDYLISLGIKKNNITLSNICTVCNGNVMHSYRYDKDKSGRNLAVITL